MEETTVPQIRCPCCDDAVRPLDATPCPECRCCPFCGQKLQRRETLCNCGQVDKPKRAAALKERFGISDAQLAYEEQKTVAAKRDRRRSIIYESAGGLMIAIGSIYSDLWGPDSFGYRLLVAAVFVSICFALVKVVEVLLARCSTPIR